MSPAAAFVVVVVATPPAVVVGDVVATEVGAAPTARVGFGTPSFGSAAVARVAALYTAQGVTHQPLRALLPPYVSLPFFKRPGGALRVRKARITFQFGNNKNKNFIFQIAHLIAAAACADAALALSGGGG